MDLADDAPARPNFPLHALLFAVTLASMTYVGNNLADGSSPLRGLAFAVPLLAILTVHELGHFVFARRHGVAVSLPYFIPFPIGLLGTLGAVIVMPDRSKSRDALLDIGASGPIAGMLVAIPVLAYGLMRSTLEPIPLHGGAEGQSLLYMAMKRLVLGPIPPGYDVMLHPIAFAGWAGLLMTMLNLMPVGQLDGGHVAYALLGPRADLLSIRARSGLRFVFVLSAVLAAHQARNFGETWWESLKASQFGATWLIYWLLLGVLTADPDRPELPAGPLWRRPFDWFVDALSGPRGVHPPTDDDRLSPGRRVIAVGTLLLFVLLFMPVPFLEH